MRAPVSRRAAFLLTTVLPVVLFLLWFFLTSGAHRVSADFLPSPGKVGEAVIELFQKHDFAVAIWTSTRRIVIAFLLAAAIAFPLGVLMGSFDVVNRLVDPVVAPLRYMPISAFIPLLILWFGIYETEKIAFLFLGVFVYLLPAVVNAVRAVPEELVDTALTLGATKLDVIRTVLVPAALPEIIDSFRVMNAISWTYVILAEVVNSNDGLGHMVELARTHQKTDWAFAGLVVIGAIGLTTDVILRGMSAAVFPWREVRQ
jgi:NitT/TauT family transport system permease protein